MDKIYVYDGSFSGFLTAVFLSYAKKEKPIDICAEGNFQTVMYAEAFYVSDEVEKAERVTNTLIKKVGRDGFFRIYEAFLSDEPGRELLLLNYIDLVLKMGRKAEYFYSEKTAAEVMRLAKKTGGEAHLLKGFLRFSETEKGVYYAEFSPKSDCLSIVAAHFCARLSALEFAINDLKRKKAAVWNGSELNIINYDSFDKPEETANEADYKEMWKSFYKKVSISERKNEKCRMTHMPKRFWRYMCETEEDTKHPCIL